MTVRIGITIGDATSVAVCRADGESDPTTFTSATVLAVDLDGNVRFADDAEVSHMRSARFATDFVGTIPRSDGFTLADGQAVRPEDLMARAVWCMVESVHSMADDDDRTLVVTHPARWSRNSRNRFRDALDHVGLPEARLVSEADAAVNQLRFEDSGDTGAAVVTADLDVVDIAIISPRTEPSAGPAPSAGPNASTRPARGITLRSAYFRGPEVIADLWPDVVDRAGFRPRRLILTGVRGDDPVLHDVCRRVSGLIPELAPHLAARGAYVIADRLSARDDVTVDPEPTTDAVPAPAVAPEPTTRSRRLLDRTPVVSGVTMLGLAAIAVGVMNATGSVSGQDRTGRESDFPTVSSTVLIPTLDGQGFFTETTEEPNAEQAPATADPETPDAGIPVSTDTYVPPVVAEPLPSATMSTEAPAPAPPQRDSATTAAPTTTWTGLPPIPPLFSSTTSPTETTEFSATSESTSTTAESSEPEAEPQSATESSTKESTSRLPWPLNSP